MSYTLTPAEHAILELGRTPYDWQIAALEAIGMQEFGGPPVALAAANGSGKTNDVIAPAISWFLRKFPQGWVVMTSGSWNQLKNQLWPSLAGLKRMNPGWRVRRGSECTVTTPEGRKTGIGSVIGFSTNDPNRAEGWHPKLPRDPLSGLSDDPVFIIVDEAKGVPDEIFGAFQRCTRKFQLWTSSPGKPEGKFFNAFGRNAGLYWTRRITSMDCPHIDPKKIEFDREELGEDSPLFRSMHLAEFTSLDNRVVMTPEALTRAFLIQPEPDTYGDRVGFSDFAAGGDEDTVSTRFGNVARLHDAWRDTDTVQSRRRHIRIYRDDLKLSEAEVWADGDGMGIPIIKDMIEEGFSPRPFRGGFPALDDKRYANLVSQVWIEGCRLIERGKINLGPRDEFSAALFEQLTTRRLEWDDRGRLRVESKKKMKERGVKSPDRADSFLGAIMGGSAMSGSVSADDFADGEHYDDEDSFRAEPVGEWR
jgi:phage terminase large subunit